MNKYNSEGIIVTQSIFVLSRSGEALTDTTPLPQRPLPTPSLLPSLSSAPSPFSALPPVPPSRAPSDTSEPSPMVSSAARSPSVSMWSLWPTTIGYEESHTLLDMTFHPSYGP